jgi:hypothetical protein
MTLNTAVYLPVWKFALESNGSARSLPLPVLRLSGSTSMIEPWQINALPVLLLRAVPLSITRLNFRESFFRAWQTFCLNRFAARMRN